MKMMTEVDFFLETMEAYQKKKLGLPCPRYASLFKPLLPKVELVNCLFNDISSYMLRVDYQIELKTRNSSYRLGKGKGQIC